MSFGGGGEGDVMSEINVTPLCDIFVVLLIIFMITGEQVTAKGPDVDLPVIEQEIKNDAKLSVTMMKDKKLYVGVDEVAQAGLKDALQGKIAEMPEGERHVIFRGDRGLLMRDVVAVMMECHAAGAEQVSIQAPQKGK